LVDRVGNTYKLPENLWQNRIRLVRYRVLLIMIMIVLLMPAYVFWNQGSPLFMGLLAIVVLSIIAISIRIMHTPSKENDDSYRSAVNAWIEENVPCPQCNGRLKVFEWFIPEYPGKRPLVTRPRCRTRCSDCGKTSTFEVGYNDVTEVLPSGLVNVL
jgi:hypothetical protein